MIVKIVGFKVGVDRSTCYYKVTIPDVDLYTQKYDEEERLSIELKLGHYMRLALEKSDFVSVRQ